MKLYPLKFDPIFHYRMWAGDKLKTVLGKQYDTPSIGESWEISAVPGSETVVLNGALKGKTINEITAIYKADFLGDSVWNAFHGEFPLLIKYIDAKTPLSIQVHPSDALARERHDSFGKNEMWYIMQADNDAQIVVGFNEQLDAVSYKKRIDNGTLSNSLNQITVNKGDTFYIPTGRVHAIGAGVLLAEIQQSSDITYRIYDYDRVDASTGKTRDLHVDQAMDAIDYSMHDNYHTAYNNDVNQVNDMVQSPYFKTNFLPIDGVVKRDHSTTDSFVIYMCVDGAASFNYDGAQYNIKMGECLFMPAAVNAFTIVAAHANVLETYL